MRRTRRVTKILLIVLTACIICSQCMTTQVFAGTKASTSKSQYSVSLNETSYTLKKGKTLKLKATLSKNAKKKGVTWSSSNKKVATVNSKGTVTAKKNGEATITAKIKGTKVKATCKITVGTPATKVTLNKSKVTLNKGSKYQLKATVTPKKASNKKVTYSSSNKKVATVNSKGKITAKKNGEATITVKVKGSKLKATCKIKVVTLATKVTLNKSKVTLDKGSTYQLKATVTPKSTSNKKVTYSSANKKVATVTSKGVIKAVGAGKAKITVKTKDGSAKKATCTVTVTEPVIDEPVIDEPITNIPTESIVLNKETLSMEPGNTEQLSTTISPENATDKSVTWSVVPASGVVTVENGLVTAVGEGTAEIKVTTADGKTDVCSVKVAYNENATNQQELNRLLASKMVTNICYTSNVAETVTIPAGDYSNKTLVINAPNADVVNSGTFKSVTINAIAENTYKECSVNVIYFNAQRGHIVVNNNGAATINMSSAGNQSLQLENNGRVADLNVPSKVNLNINGNNSVPVTLNTNATGTNIVTSIDLSITSRAAWNMTLLSGAENTRATVDNKKSMPTVVGLGCIPVRVEEDNDLINIPAEMRDDLGISQKVIVAGNVQQITLQEIESEETTEEEIEELALLEETTEEETEELTVPEETTEEETEELTVPEETTEEETEELTVPEETTEEETEELTVPEETTEEETEELTVPEETTEEETEELTVPEETTEEETEELAVPEEATEAEVEELVLPKTMVAQMTEVEVGEERTTTEIFTEISAGTSIYLIPYSSNNADMEANYATYIEALSPSVVTDEYGNYEINDVTIGNYWMVLVKEGYKTVVKNLTINSTNSEVFSNAIVSMLDNSLTNIANAETISGNIVDGLTGSSVNVAGLKVRMRTGNSNVIGEIVKETETDVNGNYAFSDVPVGVYTIEVIDLRQGLTADAIVYNSANMDILVVPGYISTNGYNCVINQQMQSVTGQGQVQFTLTWGTSESGASADIDSHIVGPTVDGTDEFHVYYSDEEYYSNDLLYVDLDVDDTDYEGPEHTTIYHETPGVYRFYIHNFSEGGYTNPTNMAKSSIQVRVTIGTSSYVYNCPNQDGNLWYVCDYNSVTHTIVPKNIVSTFNGSTSEIGLSEEKLNERYLEREKDTARAYVEEYQERLTIFDANNARAAYDSRIVEWLSAIDKAEDYMEVRTLSNQIEQATSELYDFVVWPCIDKVDGEIDKEFYCTDDEESGELKCYPKISVRTLFDASNIEIRANEGQTITTNTSENGYVVHVTLEDSGLEYDVVVQIISNLAAIRVSNEIAEIRKQLSMFETNEEIQTRQARLTELEEMILTSQEQYDIVMQEIDEMSTKLSEIKSNFYIDRIGDIDGVEDWWSSTEDVWDEDNENVLGYRKLLKIEYWNATPEGIIESLSPVFEGENVTYQIESDTIYGYYAKIVATDADSGYTMNIYVNISEW